MTHAEYVAQGYPEIYAVSDVYVDSDEMFTVEIYDWSGRTKTRSYSFVMIQDADAKKEELEAEVSQWEVEVSEDDPQADYERTEMAALKARTA